MNFTHFTQPVSMQCSQEQFEIDLKEPLEKLGYNYYRLFDFKECPIIATNYMGQNMFSNTSWNFERANNRHFIDHYNPQLFLALASMTDEPNGILGEYYTNIRRDKFTKKTSETQNSLIIDNIWLKATKEELIAHLTKKECKEQESTMENMLGNLNNLASIGKELFGGADKPKNYAEISLRIDGVLTRFIAEKEYQSTINFYEKQVKELDGRIRNQSKIIKELMEKLGKIKELL